MSEDKQSYWPPLPAPVRAHTCPAQMTPAERVVHIGELALAWARAREAFEAEYTIDSSRRCELLHVADVAEDRLRVACLAALAAVPGIGEAPCSNT